MKIKKITVQLDDGTVDHAFDHGVEAGYDIGTHVSDNLDFLLNSIGYRKQSEGKWVTIHTPLYHPVIIKCSVCNKPADKETRFCPNCGAKMKGVYNDQRKADW